MRSFLLGFFVFCSAIAGSYSAYAAGSESIAVVVNEEAITHSDVNDRLKLIMASARIPDTEETRAKLMPQVVSALIDEQIRLQEAQKLDIAVTPDEIKGGFATIAEQNKISPEQFRAMLEGAGINLDTMENQIEAQIAWTKVVQNTIRPKIVVSDSDVDSRMELMNSRIGKKEYLLADVFLPVDDPNNESETSQLALQLASDVRAGKVPFFKVAQQFSQSAGSDNGGDLGWVQQGQLDPEAERAIEMLSPNEITNPMRLIDGYHIYLLREERVTTAETMPSREDVMNTIGQERLERQAKRLLMDVKSAAYIDNRIEG